MSHLLPVPPALSPALQPSPEKGPHTPAVNTPSSRTPRLAGKHILQG